MHQLILLPDRFIPQRSTISISSNYIMECTLRLVRSVMVTRLLLDDGSSTSMSNLSEYEDPQQAVQF
jgi:hypothetical protein